MSYPAFENLFSFNGQAQVKPEKEPAVTNTPLADFVDTHEKKVIVVLGKHKYYSLFNAQLMMCGKTSGHEVKGPVKPLNPLNYAWTENSVSMLRFYLAITKFQSVYQKSAEDLISLKALATNPANFDFYLHNHNVSDRITVKSLSRIHLAHILPDVTIFVERQEKSHKVHCELVIRDTPHSINAISVLFDYFVVVDNQWYVFDNANILAILAYFKDHGPVLTVPDKDYEHFTQNVLATMDLHVLVRYATGTKVATTVTRTDIALQKVIYLSDLQNYVTITPVVKYGHTEIPIRSRRQIHEQDEKGNPIRIERHGEYEDEFMALLLRQNENFPEQFENPLLYFYLPKSYFLDRHGFLSMVDDWRGNDIRVLGFNHLKGNKFTPHKATVKIEVSSGVNWFNTHFDVRFGKTRASLQQLYKALKNRSHYIELDDGTLGILPDEWVEKFKTYFRVSERENDYTLRLRKTNYSALDELYHSSELNPAIVNEIASIREKLEDAQNIKPVTAPPDLLAELRPYQLEGLNWLNVLDELNFGGCLADDMGLGKSVQIIAFILLLQKKKGRQTHLILAPTSLMHTWKAEFAKFAPSIQLHVHHGQGKIAPLDFKNYDVIITTYGTIVSDIASLATFLFDYVFVDESQNIKNPSSQRFKAVQLLQARNRITISGTPFENNVWDLYAQFAFACPGLLGSRQYFRDSYAIPIGKFKQKNATKVLNKKIRPFILRRTKQQVASELPEKTEIIVYCELHQAQRELYLQEERKFRDELRTLTDDDVPKHTLQILKGLTKLRQICNSPMLLKDEGVAQEDSDSGKLEMLIDRITGVCDHHKVLVFSQFVSMLDLIGDKLENKNIAYTTLTGKTRDRETIINHFQQDESIRVFLISLKAGGTGLNLVAADYVFIVDPWWNPSVENQAIDRVYRIGQTKNVMAVRLICKNTIEEKMLLIKESKDSIGKYLIHENEGFTGLSKGDLMRLVSG